MATRIKTLIEASAYFDFIELEGEQDLVPEILNAIPADRRIIAWQGRPENYESLEKRFNKYRATPAKYYRLVVQTEKSGDELPVLQLLKSLNRNDLIAYATGPIGIWTQPLSAFLGSPVIPSSLDTESNHYFSPQQLIEDYDLPYTYPVQKIFGIVGNPVFGSISPQLHNEAYRSLNLPCLYVPFHANNIQEFFDEVVNGNGLPVNLSGLTVVSPFKEEGLKAAGGSQDPDVSVSGASNMLFKQNKTGWNAMSTDARGVIDALNKMGSEWQNKNIVIIGCGGTGRTIAAAFRRMNVSVTLVNRTISKGLKFATALEMPFIALGTFNPAAFDIIIHATPLGKNKGELPFDVSLLRPGSLVIDHVYSLPEATDLVKYCRLCNISVVDGIEMARLQIRHQFRQMTAAVMPDRLQSSKKLPVTENPKSNE
jgi:shikimate dehydrogenase